MCAMALIGADGCAGVGEERSVVRLRKQLTYSKISENQFLKTAPKS